MFRERGLEQRSPVVSLCASDDEPEVI